MRGQAVRLSASRRFISDAMRIAARVPTVMAQRRMQLGAIAAARVRCVGRPSWVAIFTKAFALAADDFPEVRRTYMPYPRPHLYEYPENAAVIMIERMHGDENAIFPFRIRNPGWVPIVQLSEIIRDAKTAPIEGMADFMRILRISALPSPLRRLLWWIAHNSGRLRANYFGTFVVSSLTSMGSELIHGIAPGMVLLSFGIVASDGTVDVRAMWDHRVIDGALFSRVLARMEVVLRTSILQELQSARSPTAEFTSVPDSAN
jgi:hypothetical protein